MTWHDPSFNDPNRKRQRNELYNELTLFLSNKRGMDDSDKVRVLNLVIHSIDGKDHKRFPDYIVCREKENND